MALSEGGAANRQPPSVPKLTSLTLDPEQIDRRSGEDQVTVRITATDPDGITLARVRLRPAGRTTSGDDVSVLLTKDPDHEPLRDDDGNIVTVDGQTVVESSYVGTLTVPRLAPIGQWVIREVDLVDGTGVPKFWRLGSLDSDDKDELVETLNDVGAPRALTVE